MNPFDLSGPPFLLFYLLTAVIVVGAVALLRGALESGPVPRLGEPDPYLLAHLRAGTHEAIRVATFSLIDRGLLEAKGTRIAAVPQATERVRRPLERAILEAFATPGEAANVFTLPGPRIACAELRAVLARQGLVPTRRQRMVRVLLGVGAVAILWTIAVVKIRIAAARGHHNVELLVMLALTATVAVPIVLRSRTTWVGRRTIRDFQTLFARLRDRAFAIAPGGVTNELVLLAGIFGLGALTGPSLARARDLFPKAAGQSASCGSTACGSSSCGSGGGCGGGGCGGCGS